MQHIGSLYTRHVNDRIRRDGPLFRGRFRSRQITDDRYLLAATRYVHRNALDLAGIDDPANYRWSSHRAYLGLRQTPDWLCTSHVLGLFGGDSAAFERLVRHDALDALAGEPSVAKIRSMVDAAELVLAERRTNQLDARLARSVALAWATSNGYERGLLAAAFEDPSALSSAVYRARRRVLANVELVNVMRRAAELAAARSRQESDPWRHSRAERAAS